MVTTLLIILLGLVVYCYLGYPALMSLLAKMRANRWRCDESFQPSVSVILAVYNEEKVIRDCIGSILEQDYPMDKVEILVGSDSSSDRTDDILRELSIRHASIKPFTFDQRRGKLPVLNDLVLRSTGEVLLFADADITFSRNSFRAHTRHYADPQIGCVAGYLAFSGGVTDVLKSEKAYASLENSLRNNEAKVSSTVGLFGGNYSMRRSMFRPIPDAVVHDDLFAALQVIDQGKRTVFEREAVSTEPFVRTLRDEFKRKSRNAGRGFATLALFPNLISPSAGVTAVMLWSHKILRWISPFLLASAVLLIVISQLLTQEFSLPAFNWMIAVGVAAFLIGFAFEKAKISVPVISQFYWFMVMNAAFAAGTINFLLGKEPRIWAQTTRPLSRADKEAIQL